MHAVMVLAKLAPFHAARLREAALRGRESGHMLTAIEIAAAQREYGWEPAQDAAPTVLKTLFPSADYADIAPSALRAALERALLGARPDVLFVPGWGERQGRLTLSWGMRSGVPRVMVSATQDVDHPQRESARFAKRALLRRCQAAFAAGRPHARYLVRLGMPPERTFVGCDVVDNDRVARGVRPRAEARANGALRIVSCIRLVPSKNVFGALEGLARVRGEWQWEIAGDGPHRPLIEDRLGALGLEDRVRLLGHVPYDRIPEVMSRADVYLQPSLSEPWGLAVNEAMACGLPVLVSNRCGCREDLVQEGDNGLLFDPTSAADIARAIERLLSERARWPAMGEASRRIIQAWGLPRYAEVFWQAAHAAHAARRRSPVERLLGAVLARVG